MTKYVEVSVNDMTGMALDWAVAMAEFWEADRPQDGQIRKGDVYMLVGPFRLIGLGADKFYSPSTNWAQGGPLIERELIEVSPRWHNQHCAVNQDWGKRGFKADHGWHWAAYVLGADNIDDNHEQEGGTPLIAAMRCFVSDKLGDVVQVPAVLVGVAA